MLAALAAILTFNLLLISPGQATEPPWYAASDLPVRGEVTYYAPGLMEWVYEYRLRLGQVPVCDPPACVGYVAMLRAGDLGRLVWLRPAGRPAEGPFLVVDYAASKDFERLSNRHLVAEVDHETARRWGMNRPLSDVVVLERSPYSERLYLPLVGLGDRSTEPSRPSAATQRTWLPLLLDQSP